MKEYLVVIVIKNFVTGRERVRQYLYETATPERALQKAMMRAMEWLKWSGDSNSSAITHRQMTSDPAIIAGYKEMNPNA